MFSTEVYWIFPFRYCYYKNYIWETSKIRLNSFYFILSSLKFSFKIYIWRNLIISYSHWWNMIPTEIKNKPLHAGELKFSPRWNFILGWNLFRLREHFNPRWKQEYFNPGWNQKHHLQYVYTSWYINENHC